jgi:putative DNA primase/helicase
MTMPPFENLHLKIKPYPPKSSVETVEEETLQNPEIELADLILTGPELEKYKAQAPTIFIEPYLTSHSILLVSAFRGVGKTWFSMGMAVSLAKGLPFLEYDVPHKAKVLYIDGEMPLYEIKQRIKMLSGNILPENLLVLSSERLAGKNISLNINDKNIQEEINKVIEKWSPDVIILDNLSSLSFGRDENSNSELDCLIPWWRDIRHKGIALVIVHHDGKKAKVRGASRLEDILDYSVNLEEVQSSESALFTVNFTKCRRQKPKPNKLTCALKIDGDFAELEMESFVKKPKHKDRIIKALQNKKYKYHKDLAQELGMDTTLLSKELTKLEASGHLIKKPFGLTSKGKEYHADFYDKHL